MVKLDMVDYVIYGKIIIDDIRLKSGEIVRNLLGGGGPQAAFGARLWSSSVGLLTRSGMDLTEDTKATLESLQIDLKGWYQFENIATPHGVMAYDENEYILGDKAFEARMMKVMKSIKRIMAYEIPIPESYQKPKVVHLITESVRDPITEIALSMKNKGAIYSLEPIIDFRKWSNKQEILDYLHNVDIVTPDWPSACGFANSDEPKEVLKFWASLGPKVVSVRHGVDGSYVWDREHDKMWHIPLVQVNAIDPTGCGNSYGGGFMVGWSNYKDAKIAGGMGTVSASFFAEVLGVPSIDKEKISLAKLRLENLIDRIKPL